jgi:hypothetical protein
MLFGVSQAELSPIHVETAPNGVRANWQEALQRSAIVNRRLLMSSAKRTVQRSMTSCESDEGVVTFGFA